MPTKSKTQASAEPMRVPQLRNNMAIFSKIFLGVLALSTVVRELFGHPSWWSIFVSAVEIPAAMLIANLLLERSNMLTARPHQLPRVEN